MLVEALCRASSGTVAPLAISIWRRAVISPVLLVGLEFAALSKPVQTVTLSRRVNWQHTEADGNTAEQSKPTSDSPFHFHRRGRKIRRHLMTRQRGRESFLSAGKLRNLRLSGSSACGAAGQKMVIGKAICTPGVCAYQAPGGPTPLLAVPVLPESGR